MRKETPVLAAKKLRYIAREEARGVDMGRLGEMREKALALLLRSKCCVECGRKIETKESLAAWAKDHLGPDCRARLAGVAA